MSQHFFTTTHEGRPVELLMGWDRPLQGFFMLVSRGDAGDDEVEYLYCNLDDHALVRCGGLPAAMDHFVVQLRALGIEVPPAMLAEVERDAEVNAGNRFVVYDSDGRVAREG
jgi:hypothetical protein